MLQSVLGDEYKVHITNDLYRSSHMTHINGFKTGQILMNSARVSEKNCPPILKNWDKIYFEDVAPTSEVELKIQKEIRDPIAHKLKSRLTSNIDEMFLLSRYELVIF